MVGPHDDDIGLLGIRELYEVVCETAEPEVRPEGDLPGAPEIPTIAAMSRSRRRSTPESGSTSGGTPALPYRRSTSMPSYTCPSTTSHGPPGAAR